MNNSSFFLLIIALFSFSARSADQSKKDNPDKDDFPLHIKGNHLETKSGKPFLINGDTPWSLIVGPDKAEAEMYLENRRQKGVNALMINLIEHFFNGPEDAYGNLPFLIPGDFSTPNPAYFDHADYILKKAREKGMAVFLFPAYLGYKTKDGGHKEGWYAEALANGPKKMYAYGKYVGNRYKDYKNIIWMMGGDCAPDENIEAVRAMVKGIEETAGLQIFSVHNSRFHSGITEYPADKWIDMNSTYADCSKTPAHLLADYRRNMPFFFIEGTYENEKASPVCLRSQLYWPVLMGAAGYFFGNKPVWGFEKNWQNNLNTSGSEDLSRAGKFFRSESWWDLAPDTSHTVLTSGYGNLTDGTYASAAVTKNGNNLIVYSPDKRELVINLSSLKGKKSHVLWYQPSNGKTYDLGTFRNEGMHGFTPPGEGDWLFLVYGAKH